MGGEVIITGTAYGETDDLYNAWQRALADRAAFVGSFANDTIETDIDGLKITIRREFLVRPDQMTVNVIPPTPTPRTMYGTATAGLRVRDKPVTGSVLGILAYGQPVDVLDSGTDGWIKIPNWQGKVGYCSLQYLSANRPT